MNRPALLILTMALIALPMSAQSGIDIGVWAVSTTLQGDNVINDVDDIEIEFDEEIGYGVTADVFWTDLISTEIGLYGLKSDSTMVLGFLDETVNLGSLDIMPVTLTLRLHFGGDRFDGYVGAGGVYAMFENLRSSDLELGGTEHLDIDDETGWLANAGFSVRITNSLAIGVDAKWIPLDVTVEDDQELEAIDLELDPLMISGGLLLRF